MTRKNARIEAFKIIFEVDCKKETVDEVLSLRDSLSCYAEAGDETLQKAPCGQEQYIDKIVRGVFNNIQLLDNEITASLKKWQIGRLPKVSLAVLRLALYEMKFCDDIPVSVSINEAVDIAKKYGDSEMAGFVNGILGHLSKS